MPNDLFQESPCPVCFRYKVVQVGNRLECSGCGWALLEQDGKLLVVPVQGPPVIAISAENDPSIGGQWRGE